jgi:hypothetical protein
MKNILVSLVLIVTITACMNGQVDDTLIKQAEIYMKGAKMEADKWLEVFNQKGYSIFTDQQYPPPFDKILIDSTNKEEVQKWFNFMEQEFGKVKKREFFGIHIITKGKLLTYVPDRMKNFQQMSPKIMGLHEVNQLYIKNIEGTYANLMYFSKPEKKEKAQELIVLWLDTNSKWNFLIYKIADDI